MTNAVSGVTAGGALTLSQSSYAGNGGNSEGGGAGKGGAANAALTFDDTGNTTQSASINALDAAYGGAGGAASPDTGGTIGLAGGGGAATSTLSLKGASTLKGTASAYGGDGGYNSSGTQAAGGAATSSATVTGTNATSVANAVAGALSNVSAKTGAATATATARAIGVAGVSQATAESDPGQGALVQSLSAFAKGVVDGASGANSTSSSYALTAFASAVPAFRTDTQALASVTGLPTTANVNTVLSSNPNTKAAFGATGSYFALGELGGSYDVNGHASETISDAVSMTIDPSLLTNPKDLIVGFYNGAAIGSGFQALSINIAANGTTLLAKAFTAATASAFFTDDPLDLGSILGLEANGLVNLKITLSETVASANSGYFSNFIVGDPPHLGSQELFASPAQTPDVAHAAELPYALFESFFGDSGGVMSTAPTTPAASPYVGADSLAGAHPLGHA
jgi:hypothetical protein